VAAPDDEKPEPGSSGATISVPIGEPMEAPSAAAAAVAADPAVESAPEAEPEPMAAASAAQVPADPAPADQAPADQAPADHAPDARWTPVPDVKPRQISLAIADQPDDEEPDAAEVRRQIAVATRSFDPDHQIRRAMDAFLSPPPSGEHRPD